MVMPAEAPNLFFFEVGQWWDFAMLFLVIAVLAALAWLAIRFKWAAIALFIVVPVLLTIFWWPHSIPGTQSEGWFAIAKQYSALAGSLCLVALQYFPKLRRNRFYLLIPPIILSINILEAVIRDFQCYSLHGNVNNGMWVWGGPWNIMNGIAGILNLLMIAGWTGIYVSKTNRHIIWTDLTIGWIIAYDLWNVAYCYNCLSDRAWYSGVALLLSCTIPAFMTMGRGAWIQYRAYTLTFWSAFVLSFPHFTQDSMFTHVASQNHAALFLLSFLALAANAGLAVYHVWKIVKTKRNPFKTELYTDLPQNVKIIRRTATDEVKSRIAARLGKTPQELGYLD
ncbi:DUF5692 family protein [Mobiluncus curtisii]|uniref:Uncharacterized protein n=2 Tax=Mobiluncus curtisii TaxID=2051 RepID=D6ZJ68_MOBCV|nr:DUF5692 family protein [Mobiluncus curtisii]ADI66767.1 hypothetical protein HMPREF0573_10448 [Mobiluncus curtisii ATCC 43063]EFL93258.1 hypothetical protein HMPREF0574_1859 [Mobiluncus curtisii subsp. curtisii ATCC 35241]MCU9986742.1 hypothetical protein [Mobiluncus curtisii]MCU9999643.1 hypothetical protein [Mobiluncus curtisii]MCV0021112.1 hypothetical protein [Mobiluncus curtisii]